MSENNKSADGVVPTPSAKTADQVRLDALEKLVNTQAEEIKQLKQGIKTTSKSISTAPISENPILVKEGTETYRAVVCGIHSDGYVNFATATEKELIGYKSKYPHLFTKLK
jgi:hypothetical protein